MSQLKGSDKLIRRLRALEDTRPILREVQLRSIAEAKALVPRKTGHLGRSILPGALTATHATVEARTPYAAAVEFGTRPHIIRPVKARMLAWPASRRLSGRSRTSGGKAVGPFIRAMLVRHPGTKPQPYLIPAIHKVLNDGGWREVIIGRWNGAA